MSKKFIEKRVAEELMLYDQGKDDVHILNKSAELVYKLSQQGKSQDEIRKIFLNTFDVEKDNLDNDIEMCLKELKEKELI